MSEAERPALHPGATTKTVTIHDDQGQSSGTDRHNTVTMPTADYFALARDAARWRRLIEWDDLNRFELVSEIKSRRRLVSVEHCAESGCNDTIELVHPWPKWAVAQLPDLSWVRCERHQRRRAS
jgi:hypothetical protein